jgi:hypothetical protein
MSPINAASVGPALLDDELELTLEDEFPLEALLLDELEAAELLELLTLLLVLETELELIELLDTLMLDEFPTGRGEEPPPPQALTTQHTTVARISRQELIECF